MSRTIRRKGDVPEWVKEDSYYEKKTWILITVQLRGKALKRAIAKYHRDTKEGYGWCGSAPKDFRKSIDRGKRAKDRMETNRILKQGDYESYSFAPRRKDAGWLYW